jgi:hypothetical protein
MERFGILAVRGSTTRNSLRLIKSLLGAVRNGRSCGITPDGPRGPAFTVQPGVILLSRHTGLPIYPVGVAVARGWVFGSWDAFILPKPFSRIAISIGNPLRPDEFTGRNYDRSCERLRRKIVEQTAYAGRAITA